MELTELYRASLIAAFAVFMAYSALNLLSINISNPRYSGFNQTKRVFGTTLLMWSAFIITHALLNVRYTNNYLAISLSLSSFFMLTCGFEMALHTLLDSHYLTRKVVGRELLPWIVYSLAIVANYLFTPANIQNYSILVFSLPLLVKVYVATRNTIRRYNDVSKNIDNYYSDDSSASVIWIRNCGYMLFALGFAIVFIPYGSALIDTVTAYIAIAAMSYVMISLNNYSVAIGNIHHSLIDSSKEDKSLKHLSDAKSKTIEKLLENWITLHRFTVHGITIDDVAEDIKSNRTYVSEFINGHYNLSFRNWIAKLRIEYSKSLLLQYPDYPVAKIAEMAGYARTSYITAFTKEIQMTPNQWRSLNQK